MRRQEHVQPVVVTVVRQVARGADLSDDAAVPLGGRAADRQIGLR